MYSSEMHQEPNRPTRVSLDLSVVIDYAFRPGKSTMLGKKYLTTPLIEGIEKTIQTTAHHLGSENIFVLTVAGETVQERLWHWMRFHQFHERHSIAKTNTIFFATNEQKVAFIRKNHIKHIVERKISALLPWQNDHLEHTLCLFRPNTSELEPHAKIQLPIRYYETTEGLEKAILILNGNPSDMIDIGCQL